MITAGQCVIGFVGWTLVHIGAIGCYRITAIGKGAKANSFPSGQQHGGPDWYHRVTRAHANCIENLPLFASVVLLNGLYKGPNIDTLAQIYMGARICQSLAHWSSGRGRAAIIRFLFFGVQLIVLGRMAQLTWTSL